MSPNVITRLIKHRPSSISRQNFYKISLPYFSTNSPPKETLIDWDDWMKQYPEICAESATALRNKCQADEHFLSSRSSHLPTIDWDYWRKEIRSPGVVNVLQAEHKAKSLPEYDIFHMDDLKNSEKTRLLDPKSPEAEQIDLIGREMVQKGIKKTLQDSMQRKLETAKEMAQQAVFELEELQKDLDQLETFVKRAHTRSLREDLAEFPDFARQMEESNFGNNYGTGVLPFAIDPLIEIELDMEQENRNDIEMVEHVLRNNDKAIAEKLERFKDMGFEVEREKYLESCMANIERTLEDLRRFCRETRERVNLDPETGEFLTEKGRDVFVKISGGG